MIVLGSTTELYLPADLEPKVAIQQGQKVYAGLTVLATVTSKDQLEPDSEAVKPPEQPPEQPPAQQPKQAATPSEYEEAKPARSPSA